MSGRRDARRRVLKRGAPMNEFSPADPTVVDGYKYDSTSTMWKGLCNDLPCDTLMAWSGYATAIHEVEIDGQPAVIQCWKGFCTDLVANIELPQPFGDIEFPGGFGAEVGVYRRDSTRQAPDGLPPAYPPEWPGVFRAVADAWFKLRIAKLDLLNQNDYWWPANDLVVASGVPVSFSLVDPLFSDPLISEYSTNTYWTCQWMRPGSWAEWAVAWVKKHTEMSQSGPRHPSLPSVADFILNFSVAGVDYVWDVTGIH
jgi:hypothetical protein